MTDPNTSPAPDTPPAVVCVSVSAALGGSEWSLLEFARRARQQGIDAAVLLPKDGPLVQELARVGVRTAIAPAKNDFLALTQREMLSLGGAMTLAAGLALWSRNIIRESVKLLGRDPAIIYSNGFKAHLAGIMVPGPKHVWHLREFPPERMGFVWRLLAGALPTRAIANSKAVADAWQTAGFAAPAVVHNGVDLELFQPHPRTFWLHDQLGIPHSARLIGMPAVFARWKGHLQVVEAFERAAQEVADAHLVLVGGNIYDTTAERGFAEELVRRVGRSSLGGTGPKLNDRIHFVRHMPEPWRLYPEFDVAVHFSTRPEPFGRVIAESLACGVPAIAARAGGPLEILEDGVTGWLVTPGDVAALARAMVTALTADRDAMRVRCRKDAEARFSGERYAAEVAEVLKECVRKPEG